MLFFFPFLFFENYARYRRIVSAFRFAGDDRFATSAELLFSPSLSFFPSFSPGIEEGFRIDFLLSLRGYCFTSAIRRDHKFHLTLNHPLGKLSSLMPRERLFPPLPSFPPTVSSDLCFYFRFLFLYYVPQHAT